MASFGALFFARPQKYLPAFDIAELRKRIVLVRRDSGVLLTQADGAQGLGHLPLAYLHAPLRL
jgi:hypothetical protein